MVGRDRIGDVLQQHGLAGTGRRDDQAALSFTEGRKQIHDARTDVLAHRLEFQPLLGIQGRQIVEEDLVAGLVG